MTMQLQAPNRLPAAFFGHGNPLNALRSNTVTASWAAVGKELARPRAVLAISAHWYTNGTRITATPAPRTIHDFGNFPPALFEIEYPAKGDPALAAYIAELLASLKIDLDEERGLDHGTWSVLKHVFPEADVPVLQLSIDKRQPPAFHYQLGQLLRPLRDEGVFIVGSGNIVHNLQTYNWNQDDAPPQPWAQRFESEVRELLTTSSHDKLTNYELLAGAAQSVPTPEHYLPLLYVLGSQHDDEPVIFPAEGFDGGSISMLSVQIGETIH